MLFCLLVFSIEVCTEVYKISQRNQNKLPATSVNFNKGSEKRRKQWIYFQQDFVLLQQATIIKVCFNDKVFSYNHQLLISKGCVNILRIKMMNIITLSANKLQYFKLPTSHSQCLQPNLTLASFLYEQGKII